MGTDKGVYVHSDFAFLQCERAGSLGLFSVQMSVYQMGIRSRSCDSIMAIEPPLRENRTALFEEIARVLKPNGTACLEKRPRFLTIFGNQPKGYQGIGRDDIKYLRKLGFERVRVFCWGVVPGRFWSERNKVLFRLIEAFFSLLGFGIRKVVVAKEGAN
jgi:hypothetical protein